MNKEELNQYLLEITQMLEHGQNLNSIINHINSRNLDQEHVEYILKHIKKLHHAKRTKNGSTLALIGVVFLGLGFIFSMILHSTGNSLEWSLYGLTSIGAILVLIGLFLIFN